MKDSIQDARDQAVSQVSDALHYLLNSLRTLNSCDGIYDLDLAEAIADAFGQNNAAIEKINLLIRDLQTANDSLKDVLEDV